MPTLRQPEATNLFMRDHWPEPLRQAGIKLRLLCREGAWPGGLTQAERRVLERIAAGDEAACELISGPGSNRLDADIALAALGYAHLQPR